MPTVIAPTRIKLQNILFATDFSPLAQTALPHAVDLAHRYGAKLYTVNVLPHMPFVEAAQPDPEEVRLSAKQRLTALTSCASSRGVEHEELIVQGEVPEVISKIVRKYAIDLIVIGTGGRKGLGKLLLGSVAEQVLRHATCPVMTVGPDVLRTLVEHQRLSHVLYATDFSEGSLHAVPFALSLAEENNAELTMMHVLEQLEPMPMQYSKELLADYRKRLWEMLPDDANLWCKPHVSVAVGEASGEIVRLAHDRQVDLIVMGAHGGGPVASHLPWTVVHSVVRHARCPVLTVRGTRAAG